MPLRDGPQPWWDLTTSVVTRADQTLEQLDKADSTAIVIVNVVNQREALAVEKALSAIKKEAAIVL